MNQPIRLGIVGVGKIVRNQHIPAIENDPAFALVAAASRNATVDGVRNFTTIEEMVEAIQDLDAVALCMPPQYRYAAARTAIQAGLHVLLEKPPGANVSEVQALARLAASSKVSLFATWHLRCAGVVAQAREMLADAPIQRVNIVWKEDVRKWHPGQEWIWQAGGLGVFDPGVNALSVLTHIVPQALFVTSSHLVFPENRAAPIAAKLTLAGVEGAQVDVEFDWDIAGGEVWDIEVETDQAKIALSKGGSVLSVNGETRAQTDDVEYPGLYRQFAELIRNRESDVDLSPLQIAADAFLQAEREITKPFHY